MPTTDDLAQSKYLKKEDVEPHLQLTIAGYIYENLAMQGQPVDNKYILTWKEVDPKTGKLVKPMVLNKVNGDRIAYLLGTKDFDEWTGRQITLFNDTTVEFAGRMTGGIRVYVPQQQPNIPNAAANQAKIDAAYPRSIRSEADDTPPAPTDADVPGDLDKPTPY